MLRYVKQRVAISTADWTPIVAPIVCNYFGCKNLDGSALLLRTDVNDDQTEDTLPANAQEGVIATVVASMVGAPRFQEGEPVFWVKATVGVGPVIVTWVL